MLAQARLQTIVCCSHLETSAAFYGDLLKLPLREERFNGLVYDVGGSDLCVSVVPDDKRSPHTIAGFSVPDAAAAAASLKERGLVFERVEGVDFDEGGLATAPDGTRVGWFRDPDGNWLSLVQLPPAP